jgi:hypothetical protein
MEAVRRTHPDWVIPGTAFTTLTVNHNWRTAMHKDDGDLQEGFGVLTAMGEWDGCHLIFPKYRVAVDMEECGVLLADVHETHCNSPFIGDEEHDRMSVVFYYRTGMPACLSAQEEEYRAKHRQPGDRLY